MVKEIIKRDGRKENFDRNKIANAIFKSAKSVGGENFKESQDLALLVENYINDKFKDAPPTVEQVQDAVEYVLIEKGHSKTSKSYIIYRADRSRAREMNSGLMKIYEDLTFKDAKDTDIKRENANIDGNTAMGTMLRYGSEGAKRFNELYVLRPEHSRAHINGDIHIHDMDFLTLTTTCCQIDLIKLFQNGFSTGHGFLREPNDINSYAALAAIAIQSNQNDQHGGQSVPNFEYALAFGVKKTFVKKYFENMKKALVLRYDEQNLDDFGITDCKPQIDRNCPYYEKEFAVLCKLLGKKKAEFLQDYTYKAAVKETDRATFQAMEALVHNLNTMHSRAGAQIPFSSINYGLDTSEEGRMVMKNMLLATEKGLGNGETPIFPIQIFKIKEGINYNPNDPNYDLFKLAIKVSAKRLFPNFSFIDAPFNLQYYKEGDYNTEVAYMGCRTRVIGNEYDKSKEIVTGRGNLSFTSINLVRLAIKAKKDVNKFFDSLDKMIDLCCCQLLDRYEIQARKKVKNFPFLMGQGIWIDSEKLSYDDEIREVLKHGTLSVGFIGLAETLKALLGVHHGESVEAQELGLKIVSHMRKRMDDETQKTGYNFTLLATPAEGLSGRFVKIDKKKFGKISGITDRDYYTNSFHIPVYFNISAYDKINLEAPYHKMTNAGHISYVELDGSPLNNLEAFEKIVRCMKESGIGYGSINHPLDRDPCCGYSGIINDECPKCGRKEVDGKPKFERIRRITGYLVGTVDRFNNAKRSEEHDRVKHNL